MSRLNKIISYVSVAFLWSGVIWAQASFNLSAPVRSDVPVEISADAFSASSNGWIVADGNVLVRQNDMQITADHIRVNKETGDIVAEGDVVLVREGQGVTRTDRLAYNYKTGEGVTPKLDVHSSVFRVISEKATRLDDGSYTLYDVKVTTCTNDETCLHYYVKAKEAREAGYTFSVVCSYDVQDRIFRALIDGADVEDAADGTILVKEKK